MLISVALEENPNPQILWTTSGKNKASHTDEEG